jgi:hypothetical protein
MEGLGVLVAECFQIGITRIRNHRLQFIAIDGGEQRADSRVIGAAGFQSLSDEDVVLQPAVGELGSLRGIRRTTGFQLEVPGK